MPYSLECCAVRPAVVADGAPLRFPCEAPATHAFFFFFPPHFFGSTATTKPFPLRRTAPHPVAGSPPCPSFPSGNPAGGFIPTTSVPQRDCTGVSPLCPAVTFSKSWPKDASCCRAQCQWRANMHQKIRDTLTTVTATACSLVGYQASREVWLTHTGAGGDHGTGKI
eukprot:COSAG01_NODE_24428_length_779_cov_1.172059_1_plen_167_part_00